MALTRSMLNGMGLTADQISAIIEAHTETVEGLKASVKEAEKKAEGYDALVAEKGKLEKKYEALKEASGSDDWKAKYEKEKADFKAYKDEQANKKAMDDKKAVYTELLKDAGISEKRIESILRVTDFTNMELVEDGKFKDSEKIIENIKAEWSDFITTTETRGIKTATPPKNTGASMSKEDIMKIEDDGERQKAIAENHDLFGF